MDAYLNIDWI